MHLAISAQDAYVRICNKLQYLLIT